MPNCHEKCLRWLDSDRMNFSQSSEIIEIIYNSQTAAGVRRWKSLDFRLFASLFFIFLVCDQRTYVRTQSAVQCAVYIFALFTASGVLATEVRKKAEITRVCMKN